MNNLDELILEASDSDDHASIKKLLGAIRTLPKYAIEKIKPEIELLLESWGDSVSSSRPRAEFCLSIASLKIFDSQLFRSALQKTFACLNKSEIQNTSLINASGIKDNSVPLHVSADRFKTATSLAPGKRVFNIDSKCFGSLQKVDPITSEIEIRWDNSAAASNSRAPLDKALTGMIFFEDIPALRDIASPSTKLIPSKAFREKVSRAFLPSNITDAPRTIARALLPEKFPDSARFDSWWNDNSDVEEIKKDNRHPSQARSIHELHSLMKNYKGPRLSSEDISSLYQFFTKIKTPISDDNSILIIEAIVQLAEISDEGSINSICSAIRHKAPFWPNLGEIPGKQLAMLWGRVPLKTLAKFADITAKTISQDYLASIIHMLPLRCWSAVIQAIPAEMIAKHLMEDPALSSDALIWIWKNHAKLPQQIAGRITPENVLNAISRQISDSSSQASTLKDMLLSDKSFQQALVATVSESPERMMHSVQACEAFRIDEKQSLLVKMSNISPHIKSFLEQGYAKKIFATAEKKHIRQKKEALLSVTSIASFNKLKNELDDIVNRQIPKNSAAIAHARSYGDLRENAEYKAAKERQALLSKRRLELEKALNSVQVTDFYDVEPHGTACPGSMVTLSYDGAGEPETFILLGVWDGDPDKKILSCVSRLGQALNGKTIGDSFIAPDGREARISAVEKLPPHIIIDISG